MVFEDRTLACVECGESFTFSVDDQQYHQEKGYTNEPKRCPNCRQARRSERRYGDNFGGGGWRWRWRRWRRWRRRIWRELRPAPDVPREMRPVRRRCRSAVPASRRPARLLQRLLQAAARQSAQLPLGACQPTAGTHWVPRPGRQDRHLGAGVAWPVRQRRRWAKELYGEERGHRGRRHSHGGVA